jgi:hypothetical protein
MAAARKLGEMLAEQIQRGGDRKSNFHHGNLKLSDLGIERIASYRWQKLAAIPEKILEQYIS